MIRVLLPWDTDVNCCTWMLALKNNTSTNYDPYFSYIMLHNSVTHECKQPQLWEPIMVENVRTHSFPIIHCGGFQQCPAAALHTVIYSHEALRAELRNGCVACVDTTV